MVFVVLGSIYGGITGITEAAGMGVVAVLLIIVIRREMSWGLFKEALMRTWKSTGTILWITFGATRWPALHHRRRSDLCGQSHYRHRTADFGILLLMMLIFLILGAVMDWVGDRLAGHAGLPAHRPETAGRGTGSHQRPGGCAQLCGGLVRYSVLREHAGEFPQPAFRTSGLYLKSVAPPHITLPEIFRGFLPFIVLQLFVLTLVLLFPEITMIFRSG